MQPFFLDGAARPVFCVYHPPKADTPDNGDVLYLPPFAEEMNRSRFMAAMLARSLAESGIGTLILDPHGTGDSAGDFTDGRWTTWLGDAEAALSWLSGKERAGISLVGLRLGAVLALDLLARTTHPINHLVLWQAVTSGSQFITQFLRIRMAAGLTGEKGETTKDLRDRLNAGTAVEVAGYMLSADLAADIDALKLGDFDPRPTPVSWFELVSDEGREATPAARRQIDVWRAAGMDVQLRPIVGEPFWSLQETATAPNLIDATRQTLTDGKAPA